MAESILRNKAKNFAKEVVLICREIKEIKRENILSNQLLRSGTSIGANVYEAEYAQSKSDFVSKLHIAQKECYETNYWLELLFETEYIKEDKYISLKNKNEEIMRILISSLKTAKSKLDY